MYIKVYLRKKKKSGFRQNVRGCMDFIIQNVWLIVWIVCESTAVQDRLLDCRKKLNILSVLAPFIKNPTRFLFLLRSLSELVGFFHILIIGNITEAQSTTIYTGDPFTIAWNPHAWTLEPHVWDKYFTDGRERKRRRRDLESVIQTHILGIRVFVHCQRRKLSSLRNACCSDQIS